MLTVLVHIIASIFSVILMTISVCFITEKQKKKSIDRLEEKGIKVHADPSIIMPYVAELDGNQRSVAKYKGIRGEVRVYEEVVKEYNLSHKEVTDELEHELYHKAMSESTLTGKERKEINKARKAYHIYSVLHDISKNIRTLESKITETEHRYLRHEIDVKEMKAQTSHLRDILDERKERYNRYHNSNIGKIPRGMTEDRTNELLFDFLPKRTKNIKNIGESFTQFLNLYNAGYDSENDLDEGTKYEDFLGDETCTDIFGEKIFESEVYDSPEQKAVYKDIASLYRALQAEDIDKKEIMQIILPFSKYIHDKTEINYILSSEDAFSEFLSLVNETGDKRKVAEKWLRRKAAKSASQMFEQV